MGMVLLVIMVILYVISCLFLIVIILGQEGKGGGLSGLAGASALGDALGASAAESTLRRWTRNCAILFIVLSLGLTLVGSRVFRQSMFDGKAGAAPGDILESPPEATTPPLTTPADQRTSPGGPGAVQVEPLAPAAEAPPGTAPKAPVKPVEVQAEITDFGLDAPPPAADKPSSPPNP